MMTKSMLAIAMATTLTAVDVCAVVDVAAFSLPEGAVLSIEAGSQFSMGGDSCSSNAVSLSSTMIAGSKGLYVGANMGDFSSGSHGGAPVLTDRGAVTDMWLYFSNTGVNYLSETVGSGSFGGDTASGVDMSSWTVGWNGIAQIPMGGCQYGDPANNEGFSGCDENPPGPTPPDGVDDYDDSAPAMLTCGVDCSDGDTYTIVHTAHVPVGDPSNFGGVQYDLCLVGTITVAGSLPANTTAPTVGDDNFLASSNATRYTPNITHNDTDPEINDAPSKSTLDLDPSTTGVVDQINVATAQGGTVSFDPATGVLIYEPMFNFEGIDTFNYTIKDFRTAMVSNVATVTISVGNVAPVANDDLVGNIVIFPADTFVDIDVLVNDTDVNNNIDNTTIDLDPLTVGQQSFVITAHGEAADLGGGIIRYTQTETSYVGQDTFSYTVKDTGGFVTAPQESNVAEVVVYLPYEDGPIGGVPNAYLMLDAGSVVDRHTQPAVGDGSWFSMELQPNAITYTAIVGLNHIQVSETITQPALSPNMPNIDNPWIFFGNVGLSQTTKPVKQLTNNFATGIATLDFSGWGVSWNGIPSINLGSGQDNGIATLTCYTDLVAGTQGNCSNDGEEFILTYRAVVPLGDVSGFGGANYAIHFEGHVSAFFPEPGCRISTALADVTDVSIIDDCISSSPTLSFTPGLTAAAAGNTTGLNLTAADIGIADPSFNPEGGAMCVGGCFDFIVDGIASDHVDIVIKLSAPIPVGSIFRKLVNGSWQDFDILDRDQIGSQSLDATTGHCQGPEGIFDTGLRPGAQCLYLRIYDGGPNDADGIANGTVVDPGGVLLAGPPIVPAPVVDPVSDPVSAVTSSSSSSGCSISSTPVNLSERADWLLMAGFLAVMGLVSCERRRHNKRGF